RVIEMARDSDLRVWPGGDRQARRGMDGHERDGSPHLCLISRCLEAKGRERHPGGLWDSRAIGLAAAEPGCSEAQRCVAVTGDGVTTGILRSRALQVDERV